MTRTILPIIITIFFSLEAIADEGMWLPQLLKTMNEEDMQASNGCDSTCFTQR